MPINARFDGEVAVLSNFGRLVNDPRHFDASRDVQGLIDEGYRWFVLDLKGYRDLGSTGLGLLMTLTRLIRRNDGDAVLANLTPAAVKFVDEMRVDSYWELFEDVSEASAFYQERARPKKAIGGEDG